MSKKCAQARNTDLTIVMLLCCLELVTSTPIPAISEETISGRHSTVLSDVIDEVLPLSTSCVAGFPHIEPNVVSVECHGVVTDSLATAV